MAEKPRVAVHKFASCDGCQLAFLNMGEELLTLARLVDMVHFAEAGPVNPDASVDIAFIEGSISTPEDAERILRIRARSRHLITVGACATSGGLQALRNFADGKEWLAAIYAKPEYVHSLGASTPISQHVKMLSSLVTITIRARATSSPRAAAATPRCPMARTAVPARPVRAAPAWPR